MTRKHQITPDKARSALIRIAMLHDAAEYKRVSKTDLWEALKYARHIAKCVLEEEAKEARGA